MKGIRIFVPLGMLALAAGVRAIPQQAVPPAPKPVDSGPTLAVTMQFLQTQMIEQGQLGYVVAESDHPGIITRHLRRFSNIVADIQGCKMVITDTDSKQYELTSDAPPSTVTPRNVQTAYTTTLSFAKLVSITVDSYESSLNRSNAERAHPELTSTVVPQIFQLTLRASEGMPVHFTNTYATVPPLIFDHPSKRIDYDFRSEETANRVAKAFTHAIELCGGGNKDPF